MTMASQGDKRFQSWLSQWIKNCNIKVIDLSFENWFDYLYEFISKQNISMYFGSKLLSSSEFELFIVKQLKMYKSMTP